MLKSIKTFLTVSLILRIATLSVFALCLGACSGFFDKDNTPPPSPLVSFTPEIRIQPLWSVKTGWGSSHEYLKLQPILANETLWTADYNGLIVATNPLTGKRRWQTFLNIPLTSGPCVDATHVFIGTRTAALIALRQTDGGVLWKTTLSSEVLASPVSADGIVIAKTIDGFVYGLDAESGRIVWHYQKPEPTLILRGASKPVIANHSVFIGFATGQLVKLDIQTGQVEWEKIIAAPEGMFPIQRLVDIDANPLISENRVYVATYQGRIAALNIETGEEYWSHHMSSFSGMAVDDKTVYISDANSRLWAFDKRTGKLQWHQVALKARSITEPAILSTAHALIVGDAQGYLHWLSTIDGHFLARQRVDHDGIMATPIVDRTTVYIMTRNGRLAAYTVKS